MNKLELIVIGIAIIMLSVWGGCYFLHLYPYGEWQNFPIFLTSLLAFGFGVFVSSKGFKND